VTENDLSLTQIAVRATFSAAVTILVIIVVFLILRIIL
jgi:hypothetical protein